MPIMRRRFLAQSMASSALLLPPWLLAQQSSIGEWRHLADLPYPVQEIYPAILNNRIHVVGGFATLPQQSPVTDRHVVYDISADQWQTAAALPEARHHPNLVASGNRLFSLGGYKAEGNRLWVMQNQTWVYSGETDQWSSASPAPEVHGETVCVNLDNSIHVVGGRTPSGERNGDWNGQTDSNRHLLYDPTDDSWHALAPALNVRNSAAGAVIDGQLYVVGGRTVATGNVDYLEIYDPQEDRWRQAAPMPQAQGGLGAAALNGQLIAFGGEYFGAGGSGVYPEAWCYQPAQDAWREIAPMMTPRHGLGGVNDGQYVYAVAGATQAGGNGTSAVLERFTL